MTTPLDADGLAAALDALAVSYQQTEPGAFLVTLPGERRHRTLVWLMLGRHHLLITSREPIGIDGETVWTLGPLGLPDDDPLGDGVPSPAVELFLQRLESAVPTLAIDDDVRARASEIAVAVLSSICTCAVTQRLHLPTASQSAHAIS